MFQFDRILTSILFTLVLGLGDGLTNREIDEAIARDKERLPEFYNTNYRTRCRLDSPEAFYELVAIPSLKSVILEGKTFFGVLLDRLDEALKDDDDYEKVKKDWEYLSDVLLASFEDREASIRWMWKKFISVFETDVLPWEITPRKVVLIEIIGAIHYDYLVLEAAIRMAVKEIVNTSLKKPFQRIMKEVDEEMKERYGAGAPDSDVLVQNIENTLRDIEPNFVGQLLAALLSRARQIANGKWTDSKSFTAGPIEQIGIVVYAFREKSEEFASSFWTDLTGVMKQDVKNETMEVVYRRYSSSQVHVIGNVLYLLAPPKGAKK